MDFSSNDYLFSIPAESNQLPGMHPAQPAPQSPTPYGTLCTAQPANNPACCTSRCSTTNGQDYGPAPFAVNIETATLQNPYFRRALWTGNNLQLTLMCIGVGQEIGLEMHGNLDQFLRLEQGQGVVMMGNTQQNLTYHQEVTASSAIFIPAGTWHNLLNTGTQPIKLYSIYAPVKHPHGRIQCTRADADADSRMSP